MTVRQMEQRLVVLGDRYVASGSTDAVARNEYRQLHARWMQLPGTTVRRQALAEWLRRAA
jgi:hypothetical protein